MYVVTDTLKIHTGWFYYAATATTKEWKLITKLRSTLSAKYKKICKGFIEKNIPCKYR